MSFNFDLKEELRRLKEQEARAALDLSNITEQIFQLEESYLRGSPLANISRGYGAYRGQVKGKTGGDEKFRKIKQADRIFSNSSSPRSKASSKSNSSGEKGQNHASMKENTRSSQAKAPSVKTSTVQGFRRKQVFVRSRSKSQSRYIATSGARRPNVVGILKGRTKDRLPVKEQDRAAVEDLVKMSWAQLRKECLKAGLPGKFCGGKKDNMLAALLRVTP